MVEPVGNLQERKAEIRAQGLAARAQQPHREDLSRTIVATLSRLNEYQAAGVVLYYVSVPSEVHTLPLLAEALAQGKTAVIPYMDSARIALFRLESLDELAPGQFGILEPRRDLRTAAGKAVDPARIELVVIPGVGFDRQGGRVGHGRGYYDELLKRIRPEVPRIGLAYECQLFDEIPMLPHDVRMHKVVSEQAVYEAKPPENRD